MAIRPVNLAGIQNALAFLGGSLASARARNDAEEARRKARRANNMQAMGAIAGAAAGAGVAFAVPGAQPFAPALITGGAALGGHIGGAQVGEPPPATQTASGLIAAGASASATREQQIERERRDEAVRRGLPGGITPPVVVPESTTIEALPERENQFMGFPGPSPRAAPASAGPGVFLTDEQRASVLNSPDPALTLNTLAAVTSAFGRAGPVEEIRTGGGARLTVQRGPRGDVNVLATEKEGGGQAPDTLFEIIGKDGNPAAVTPEVREATGVNTPTATALTSADLMALTSAGVAGRPRKIGTGTEASGPSVEALANRAFMDRARANPEMSSDQILTKMLDEPDTSPELVNKSWLDWQDARRSGAVEPFVKAIEDIGADPAMGDARERLALVNDLLADPSAESGQAPQMDRLSEKQHTRITKVRDDLLKDAGAGMTSQRADSIFAEVTAEADPLRDSLDAVLARTRQRGVDPTLITGNTKTAYADRRQKDVDAAFKQVSEANPGASLDALGAALKEEGVEPSQVSLKAIGEHLKAGAEGDRKSFLDNVGKIAADSKGTPEKKIERIDAQIEKYRDKQRDPLTADDIKYANGLKEQIRSAAEAKAGGEKLRLGEIFDIRDVKKTAVQRLIGTEGPQNILQAINEGRLGEAIALAKLDPDDVELAEVQVLDEILRGATTIRDKDEKARARSERTRIASARTDRKLDYLQIALETPDAETGEAKGFAELRAEVEAMEAVDRQELLDYLDRREAQIKAELEAAAPQPGAPPPKRKRSIMQPSVLAPGLMMPR